MNHKEQSARFMNSKVYTGPAKVSVPNVQGEQSRCHLLQYVFCLLGVSLLIILVGRCVYRMMNRPEHMDRFLYQEEIRDELHTEFENFVKMFGRKYPSRQETLLRFEIFSNNLREIKQKQKNFNNTVFDVLTPFSDLTEDEIKKMLMPYTEPAKPSDIPTFDTSPGWAPLNRPASFDWRTKGAVMGIKNQGNCGSCWAFSVVAVVESMNIIHGGNRTKLSEQELLDCDARSHGCNGGVRQYAFEFIKKTGLVAEDSYEYTAKQGQCHLPTTGSRIFVDEVYSLGPNEEEMADWVASKGPITIGVNVTKEMFNYRSGVFNPTKEDCAQRSIGSHSMTAIGYGTLNGEDYWLLKNSWGPAHGQSGYLNMKRGVNSCGIANNVYTALITKPH